ncbi:MAG: N-acetylglucosamine-6-phosphate deacetylase [Clostridiales bacterium]|nr:N-acetylglucosamine-6-phosphate deacetylase [Clostridiales bacterium]
MKLLLKNGRLITPYRQITAGEVLISDGLIEYIRHPDEIKESLADEIIDVKGNYISPGFIDVHVHGGGGHEVMSCDADEIVKMCSAHSRYGTTSIVPTTLATPIPQLKAAMDAVRRAKKQSKDCNILGIHLEGPFLAPEQAGAQEPGSLIKPEEDTVQELLDYWDGIRIMGAAPELPGGLKLGMELTKRGIAPSIAHSNATYEQVMDAVEHGYHDVTHIYSGCSMMHRVGPFRVAGVVEAGLYADSLTTQVIADGRHLPPSLLKLIYKCKGADKIILITDGLAQSAGGGQEGDIFVQQNGVKIILEDGVMKLMNRKAFAGSVATMSRAVRTMVTLAGVPLTEAVQMATVNPARLVGANSKGVLAAGKDADLVVFDENIEVAYTITGGKVVYRG